MADIKTIQGGLLLGLIGTLTFIGGVSLFTDDNLYYCEARSLVSQCERLSSTFKTCYNLEGKGKRCYEGWQKIGTYTIPTDAVVEEKFSKLIVNARTGVWECNLKSDLPNDEYAKCQNDRGQEKYFGELD